MNLADLQSLRSDLNTYLQHVRIETEGPPAPFLKVADPWQTRDINAISPALTKLVVPGAPDPDVQRCMWIYPRGHAKTATAATLIAFVLAFSRRRRRAVWVAADKDQGCEGLDSIRTLCRHNGWLDQILTVRADKVENLRTSSVLYFTTSDVSSAFGWKDCDIFCMDEVSHWGPKGEDLWTAMYSAAGKRKGAVVFALMNAGFDGWVRELRDKAEADPNWAFSELPDAVASWISAEQLADQGKYLPKVAFDRLWRNVWSSGSGDALDPVSIDRAVTLPGPLTKPEEGWCYALGLDLGLSRDNAAAAVVGVHVGHETEIKKPARHLSSVQQAMIDVGLREEIEDEPEYIHHEGTGRLKLADMRVWTPPAKGKVDLEEIERTIVQLDSRFRLNVSCDVWQAAYLIERLAKRGIPTEGVDFTGQNLKGMCSAVLESFSENLLSLFPHSRLLGDLKALRVVEKPYGVRLESPRGPSGHGDCATGLALALLAIRKMPFSLSPVGRIIAV